ncbi:hypothetical protein, conserved [Eimeria tenella]|uniref:Uncharacterized protein n=1 Tax=Eimeria tenella TaxID=5802 RepID=U6L520_EIMTE|nr:hypothetical protein, conserved [Eimeria tenella]CDJ42875.1 hypothetical protein, conserved [Eimeria tenella]|eukprot:XP_013233625.1 hypothetical protein, conserved [Eimeria tenella]
MGPPKGPLGGPLGDPLGGPPEAPEGPPGGPPGYCGAESLLREVEERDKKLFGVVTHARAPNKPYLYPPGLFLNRQKPPPAFRPRAPDPWDHLGAPQGGAPCFQQPEGPPKAPGAPKTQPGRQGRGPEAPWGEGFLEKKTKPKRPPSKPLSLYTLPGDAAFGPHTHCRALQPFEALPFDEYLGGPGGPWGPGGPLRTPGGPLGAPGEPPGEQRRRSGGPPWGPRGAPGSPRFPWWGGPQCRGGAPLTHEEQEGLWEFGVDFRETEELFGRQFWMSHERERSKRLRHLLQKGLAVFAADLEAEEFAADCKKYLEGSRGPPGGPPQQHASCKPAAAAAAAAARAWEDSSAAFEGPLGEAPGGPLRRHGKYPRGTPRGASHGAPRGGPPEQRGPPVPWSYYFEIGNAFEGAAEDSNEEKEFEETQKETQEPDDPRLQSILETETVRLYEAATGKLPSIFGGLRKKEKHPKDITVPFNRLKAYGQKIDSITSCRKLQDEVMQELLGPCGGSSSSSKPLQHMPPPKGVRSNPNYLLTPEKIQRAAAKLHVDVAAAAAADPFAPIERRRRALPAEPTRILGGGRYAV